MKDLFDLFARGGWVSYGLALVSVMLWTAVWLRASALRADVVGAFRRTAQSSDRRDAMVERFAARLAVWKSPVRMLVVVAPLLGLLGTVAGMVELFDALHTSAAVRQGSVAGGISQALITTQLGLIIGAPGLVAARLLDRRQIRLERELRTAHRSLS